MWNTGGCQSWYLDEHGVNRSLWSGFTWEYWLATRKFKMSEYKFFGAGQPVAAQGARHAKHTMLCSRWMTHPRGSVGGGL